MDHRCKSTVAIAHDGKQSSSALGDESSRLWLLHFCIIHWAEATCLNTNGFTKRVPQKSLNKTSLLKKTPLLKCNLAAIMNLLEQRQREKIKYLGTGQADWSSQCWWASSAIQTCLLFYRDVKSLSPLCMWTASRIEECRKHCLSTVCC